MDRASQKGLGPYAQHTRKTPQAQHQKKGWPAQMLTSKRMGNITG
jgi:hypothetical protein